MDKSRRHSLVSALAGYVAVALLYVWPLPLHLANSFTGPVSGDTGVYVWNLWHFRHQIVAGRPPFFTSEILSLTPRVDLSLHNYTAFADVLAFPLIPLFGVTAAFNLTFIVVMILTAFAMFVVARRVIGTAPEAWLAGALFAFSPVLVARGTGHFSLVAAVPLPIFLLCLMRLEETPSIRYACAAGAVVAWASLCDAYYGIFCILLACCYFGTRWVHVRLRSRPAGSYVKCTRAIDLAMLGVASLAAFIILTGGTRIDLFGYRVTVYSLYTPVLALVVLGMVRAWVTLGCRPILNIYPGILMVGRLVTVAAVACALALSPVLYAFAYSFADGGAVHGRIFWRSSPPGVDLLALLMPNPNHAILGAAWRAWLTQLPGGFIENVASLTFVGMAVLVMAVWRRGFRPPRVWTAITLFFAALALGPFVHIAGLNTFVPGPWAILRYIPVIGAVRTPARFTVMLMLGFSLLFGLALRHLVECSPARRRVILAVVGGALLVELLPAPRTLYSAEIPAIYRTIAADPRDIRVLQLPFGFRDGESSVGNFSAAWQYYQTLHGKRLIGGYLSRVSRNTVRKQRRGFLTLRALIALSEGKSLSPELVELYKARGPRFIQRARVGYVVIDASRTSWELRRFAIEAFRLLKIQESDGFELYTPNPPYQP